MKTLSILFIILLVPFVSSALSEAKSKHKKYKVSGTLMQTNHYQGGVEEPPPKAYILANYTLVVVQIISDELIPKVISNKG